jgi:hypothetical protein
MAALGCAATASPDADQNRNVSDLRCALTNDCDPCLHIGVEATVVVHRVPCLSYPRRDLARGDHDLPPAPYGCSMGKGILVDPFDRLPCPNIDLRWLKCEAVNGDMDSSVVSTRRNTHGE